MAWKLQNLVDIPNLQMLMDRFYAATAIPVGILEADGEILVATGWQKICTDFHRVHPATAERCRQSDDYIKTRLAPDSPVQYKCRNGLWDLAVPIIIANEHVGSLFVGQFFYDDEEIDEEFYRRQAAEFGFDVEEYMEALRHIPIYTREKVERVMAFYTSFVNFLISTGLANYQRAEAERALRESEEKFARAFNTAPIPMAITNLDKGTYLEVNEEFERQHGYRKEEVIGHTAAELDLWCDPQQREEIVSDLKKGHEVRNREVALRDRNGALRFGLFSGAVIDLHGEKQLLALRTDITDRKHAEEALRESEEKFAKTFRFTPSILLISTIEDGRFIEVNDTFEQVLGYSREEVIGRSSREVGLWESAEARDRYIGALLEKGELRGFEVTLRSKTGDIIVGLCSAEVIDVKDELCVLTLVNDITERKRMEEKIEILNTELASRALELENANQELESFNYTVSHDLRRYITLISGYSDLALDVSSSAPIGEVKEYLKEVHNAAQQMQQLLETLLDFSLLSRSAMEVAAVDLTAIASRVGASLRLSEPERKATFDIQEGLQVFGDPKLLDVMLENLLGNAWKYTRNREEVAIEFGACETEGGRVFFVRDNGEGFDMAHAHKLFRPFERLPGTKGIPGHGIGLATVQRVIQRHNGKVWAESEPGKGATFFFQL